MGLSKIGLGGGCHWCTEAVFDALRGVETVEQGFVSACAPDDTWSEAIIAHFDPDMIALPVLIDIHLRTHASTSNHKMRGKYRSAIYVFSEMQSRRAQTALRELQAGFDAPLVTRVLSFREFRTSEERFQNYGKKHADGPFCTRYVDPKLKLLRKEYADLLHNPQSA